MIDGRHLLALVAAVFLSMGATAIYRNCKETGCTVKVLKAIRKLASVGVIVGCFVGVFVSVVAGVILGHTVFWYAFGIFAAAALGSLVAAASEPADREHRLPDLKPEPVAAPAPPPAMDWTVAGQAVGAPNLPAALQSALDAEDERMRRSLASRAEVQGALHGKRVER